MRMTIEGDYIVADCPGVEPTGNKKIIYRATGELEETHLNAPQKIVFDRRGEPLNCPRYDNGQCISHQRLEELPEMAYEILKPEASHRPIGVPFVIKTVRQKCMAVELLQKFLTDFGTKQEK